MKDSQKKKLVVIGSNSFSGAHFINLALDEGMTVTGISRSKEYDAVFLPYRWEFTEKLKRFSFLQMDLNKDLDEILKFISGFKPRYIVNFASQGMVSQSWDNPEHWIRTNTLSMIKLADKLKGCSFLKKYVHISTPEVYGNVAVSDRIKENTIYSPSTPYAVSKAAADMSLMAYHNAFDFPVVFTRSANVYGPGQQIYRIVPKTIFYFLLGKTLYLHGGGKSMRSFVHIDDVVNGTYKAMKFGNPGEIFHFATPNMVTIKELVRKIADQMKVPFDKNVQAVNELKGKDYSYPLDCSAAGERLSWKPLWSLEKGIVQTEKWIRENISFLKKQPFNYIHKE